MYCKNCGEKISEGMKFCKNCGTSVNGSDISNKKHKPSKGLFYFFHKQKFLIIASIILVILISLALIAFVFYFHKTNHDTSEISQNNPDNSEAVVDILCDNGEGGSGTIFTTTGTILTNNHVITGATSCKVTIPNPSTGQIAEAYEAAPIIVPTLSEKYDVATLQIDASYTDSDGKTWGKYPATFTPFVLPSTCSTSTPSKLGDSIRIYGYPVTSGGYDLTETDGIISSFADNGDILTSAKIDSGNSGGLAIDQNGCYLGIPSAVISGNYQNLGVLIPGNVVTQFIPNIPVKTDLVTKITGTQDIAAQEAITPQVAAPITQQSSTAPQETPEQRCQDTYGTYSETVGNNASGEPLCNCDTGYSWSADGNSCEAQTTLQAYCQSEYGIGSYSSTVGGKAECGCSTGYEWNSDESECVVPQPTCTANATYDTSTEKCECNSGYTPDGNICETDEEYCELTDGFGSTYDSSSNSCECEQGYFSYNGTCESGYSYCPDKYGSGYIYDSSTNGCTVSDY